MKKMLFIRRQTGKNSKKIEKNAKGERVHRVYGKQL